MSDKIIFIYTARHVAGHLDNGFHWILSNGDEKSVVGHPII